MDHAQNFNTQTILNSMNSALIALGLIPRIGGKVLRVLLDTFDSPSTVLNAGADELMAVPGIGKTITQQIQSLNLADIERKIARWQAEDIRIVTWDMDEYPLALRDLPDRPPVLFGRGTLPGTNSVAIVGTRQPTPTATQFAQLLAYYLTDANWTIISGLAYGIDADSHKGAVANIRNGNTVAILGSGVKCIYPPENEVLARRILNIRGGLWAEVAPEMQVSSGQLVARNRIISGLSQALVVIETGIPGGALHAVRFAREQGRPVFVVDYPAEGNQKLMAEGVSIISPDIPGIETLLDHLKS